MYTKALCAFSIAFATLAGLANAQQGPIGRMYLVEPKAGQVEEWEEAYKEHLDWHRSQNDGWDWRAYQIESGPRLGQYIIRTGGHEWKDFDARGEMGARDNTNYFDTAGKFSQSELSWFDRTHWNLSRTDEDATYHIIEYTRVVVKPSKVAEFMNAVSKFHRAFEETNDPARYVVAQTESGGRTSNFVLVGLHENWAGLEQSPDAMMKMMQRVYGPVEAAAIYEEFSSTVEEMESFILRYRPDLSYNADAATSNE